MAGVLRDPDSSLNRGFPENPTDPALWVEKVLWPDTALLLLTCILSLNPESLDREPPNGLRSDLASIIQIPPTTFLPDPLYPAQYYYTPVTTPFFLTLLLPYSPSPPFQKTYIQ